MCRPPSWFYCHPPIIPNNPVRVEPQILPLKSCSIEVKIVDFLSYVTVTQKYKNETANPLEATYHFQLEPKASVTDFFAEIDGKKITGEIQEKEKAKNTYDDSIASGHGAYMLEQSDKEDVFKASVGNLPPGKEVTIGIVYVKELEFQDGKLKFDIPSADSTSSTEPASTIKISIETTTRIQSIASPSHPISFEFGDDPSHATVTLSDGSNKVNKNFVLLVKLFNPHEPIGRVQLDSKGKKVAMVAVYPKLELADDETLFTELIFLIDRSGSMSGTRINQVKSVMSLLLKSLGEGTLFNIVGFGSKFELLFPKGSVEYNEKTLETANKHINGLTANMGGTDILNPLSSILKEPPKEGIPRQIFLLTDGEVSNTQECINTVKKHARTTRVFTFGIGEGASKELVQGIAKAGEGASEIIHDTNSMEQKVMKQLNTAMQPALTDLTINWGSLDAKSTAPFRNPPLFAGGRLVFYAFLGDNAKEGEVTVNAKTAIKPWSATVKVNPENALKGDLIIPKLASKLLIKELEEGRSYLHDDNGNLKGSNGQGTVDKEIIDLSIKSGIISKLTSFVVTEYRDEATEGEMKLVEIPSDVSGKKKVILPVPRAYPYPYPNMPLQQPQQQPLINYGPPPPRGGGMPPPPPPPGGGGPPRGPPMPPSSSFQQSIPSHIGGSLSTGSVPPSRSFAPTSSAPKSFSGSTYPSPRSPSSSSSSSISNSMSPRDQSSDYGSIPTLSSPVQSSSSEKERSRRSSPPSMKKKKENSYSEKEDRLSQVTSSLESVQMSMNNNISTLLSKNESLEPMRMMEKEEEEKKSSSPAPTNVRDIVMKQKFAGNWEIDALSSILSADKIKKGLPSSVKSSNEVLSFFATAIICAYFPLAFSEYQDSWNLVVNKAKKWIAKEIKKLSLDKEDWDAISKKLLKDNGLIK